MPSGLDTARLYTQLLNTGLQQKNNPLYQVIYSLIGALQNVGKVLDSGSGGGGGSGTTIINETIQQLLDGSGSSDSGFSDIIIPGSIGSIGLQGPQGIPGFALSDDCNYDDRGPVFPSGFWVPAGHFPFVAGDALGLNPANSSTYHYGNQSGFDPGLVTAIFPAIVETNCVIKRFSGSIIIAGVKDSAANSAFYKLAVNGTAVPEFAGITFQAALQTVNVGGVNTPVVIGDLLEMQILTPVFTTPPTLCLFYGEAYAEKWIPIL